MIHEPVIVALGAARGAALGAISAPSAEILRDAAEGVVAHLRVLLTAGYEHAPVLVLGLAATLVLPAVAVVGFVLHKAWQSGKAIAGKRVALAESSPSWPALGWIEIDEQPGMRHALAQPLVRIGRQDDNDICLSGKSVHRYHAVIRRTEDADFIVTDVSGRRGNGVRVNGARRAEARLANGDVIEIGEARLKFESVSQ